MSNTVFILGAGASKLAGVPLMKEFLDTARNLWKSKRVPQEVGQSFKTVFAAKAALQAVHSKSQFDLDNIESLFSTFEMAKMLGRFPGKDGQDPDELLRALRIVIVNTLEQTLEFPCGDSSIESPRPYGEFVTLLEQLARTDPPHKVSVITFNYDIALDDALNRNGVAADYGLDETIPELSIPLLKLHGSLNWTEAITGTEKNIVAWPLGKWWALNSVRKGRFLEIKYCRVPIGSELSQMSQSVTGEAVIVPPTFNKGDTHRALAKVWRRAALALSEAENIFVIGYSMPETDLFFRYLYALGTVGETMLDKFWLFDPDNSVEQRFRGLLGPGAQARFRHFPKTFATAIGILKETFPSAEDKVLS